MPKHAKVCKKVFVEKRKEFNVKEQRKATDATGKGIEGDSYDPYAKKRALAEAKKSEAALAAKKAKAGPMPKWKIQSM